MDEKIMGEKIMVFAWVRNPVTEGYYYKQVWGGKSIIRAFWQAWFAKGYSGCVKIEWRGTR